MEMTVRNSLIAVALATVLLTPALHASELDCDAAQTQTEMTSCAQESFQEADAELNREWKSLRDRLRQAEEDLGYKGWFDTALEAQRGWLTYRDNQCAAEGFETGGGTIQPMQIAYCKSRLTRARVRELRELNDSGGLPNGFPAAGMITVENMEAVHPRGTLYRFPRIGGDSPAALRINTVLQSQILEQTPGHERGGLFSQVWPEGDSKHGLVGLDYAITFEQPGILRVDIYREFYGASFSESLDSYHFDARSGQPITLHDLLTAEGLAQIDADIRDERLRKIDDFVSGNEVNGTRLRSDPESADEQKLLYANCRDRVAASHSVQQDKLRIDRNSYELTPERCGPRVSWALLDLDLSAYSNFILSRESLSDYGRCLLIDRRANCRRSERPQ